MKGLFNLRCAMPQNVSNKMEIGFWYCAKGGGLSGVEGKMFKANMECITSLYNKYHGYLTNLMISLFLGLIFLVLVYWNGMRRYAVLKKLNLPGPKPLPYVGNTLEIKKYGGILNYQMECMKRYGKIFAIWTPNLCIVVADPEMLKQILVKEFDNFMNRFATREVTLGSTNMFLARDENWKRIRSTVTPTFSAQKMKLMRPFFEKASDTLVGKLESVAGTGVSVNMREWIAKMFLDAVMMTAMGMESDVQSNPNHMFLKSARDFQTSHKPLQVFLNIIPFGKSLAPLVKQLTSYWNPEKPMSILETLAQTVIQSRQKLLEKGVDTGRKDLIHLMLTAYESDGVKRLSDEEILAQTMSFIHAGHDGPGIALASILYQLSKNPDIQDKLKEEIESEIEENVGMDLYDLVGSIEYLDCVINEGQRLVLTRQASNINRECAKACRINGMYFPEGTEIVWNPILLNRDPDAWTDVEKFDPERHRGPAKESRHPYQFLPFGAGPRQCIAKRFSLIEVKLTLAKIIRRFKFVPSPDKPEIPTNDSDPIYLLVEKQGVN